MGKVRLEMEIVVYQGWAKTGKGRRVVVGHAMVKEDFTSNVMLFFSEKEEPMSQVFVRDSYAFTYGVCQPEKDAPLELAAWPKRAYPSRPEA